MKNQNENTNINSYILHQRRNERVIYGTEEIELVKILKNIFKNWMKIKKASEKIANKRNCPNTCTSMIFEGDPGQGKQNRICMQRFIWNWKYYNYKVFLSKGFI